MKKLLTRGAVFMMAMVMTASLAACGGTKDKGEKGASGEQVETTVGKKPEKPQAVKDTQPETTAPPQTIPPTTAAPSESTTTPQTKSAETGPGAGNSVSESTGSKDEKKEDKPSDEAAKKDKSVKKDTTGKKGKKDKKNKKAKSNKKTKSSEKVKN